MPKIDPADIASFDDAPPPARAVRPEDIASFDDEGPGAAEAAVRGFNQGATLGFADEAIAKIEEALPWTRTTVGELAQGKVNKAPAQTYVQARDAQRALERRTEEAQPEAYFGGQLAGGLAAESALATATGGASLTPTAQAGLGAVAGLGNSQADLTKGEYGRAALDTAVGGAIGGVAGKLGQKVGEGLEWAGKKLGGRAARGVAEATDEIRQAATKAQTEAEQSALGKLRSKVQEASRDLEVMAREAENLPDGPLKDSLKSFLNSPEGLAVREQVAGNKLLSAPERVGDIATKRAEHDALVAARETNIAKSVDSATNLGETWRTQIKPRIATLGHRFIPGAVGTAIGGAPGAAIGLGVSLVQGRPGTIVANAVKSPRVRYAGWKVIQSIAQSQPQALGKWGPALSRALARGERSFAVAHRVLADRDPEYREAVAKLEDEQGNDQAANR